MSDSFNRSYFHLLPKKVLLKIVSQLDTVDLLNFCEIYECDHFLRDRNVIKTLNLYKSYALPDLKLLSEKIIFSYVTTLNINCLYWISRSVLRKFVIKLVNLKNLYAVKTPLSLKSSDIEVYKAIKVEKLAVTVRKNTEMGFSILPTVTTLYINFIKTTSVVTPIALEMHFPQLSKLWIELEEPSSAKLISSSLSLGSKTKVFCKINAPIRCLHVDYLGLKFYTMCCEKFTPVELLDTVEDEVRANLVDAWKILYELRCPLPYGAKDARRLYLKEASLANICFEELNFHHIGPVCIERCREAQKEILKSSNAKTVKKLCLMSCLLGNEEDTHSSVRESYRFNRFKKKRIAIVNSVDAHSAEAIFANFPNLECLEILCCNKFCVPSSIQAYPLIAKFDKLLSLRLEIPVTVDGRFFLEVFKNCTRLESLKVTSTAQHEILNFNLCHAIPNALALKDLRFENRRIYIDKLIARLCLIKSKKLQRLVLVCSEIDKLSLAALKNFLESNPQLVFLYFLIRDATLKSLRIVQQTLNKFKKDHPAKIFFAKRSIIGEIGHPIPEVHFREMMEVESDVANLQVLEDFNSF